LNKVNRVTRDQGTDAVTELDTERLARRIESCTTGVDRRFRFSTIELYHRAALSIRVSLDARDGTASRAGAEQGMAIRAEPVEGREVRFAAGSGGGEETLERLLELASRGTGGEWSAGWTAAGGELSDVDADGGLPAPAELTDWLQRARSRLARAPVDGCWVEVGRTVESWVGSAGLRARRERTRAWALARRTARPLIVASRGFDALRAEGWAELMTDRTAHEPTGEPAPGGSPLLFFTGETSALLVQALARAIHGGGAEPVRAVGPGWRLADDPVAPGALFGGRFDDAGFSTNRTVLADGEGLPVRLEERGHWRRPSFRDRPVVMPANLVVDPPSVEPPERALLVSGLTIHPLAPDRWILEVEGPSPETVEPERTAPTRWIETSPGRLVERCLGGFGPPRSFHRGVTTPALLFDS
jgi:hypothetical protein